MNLKTILNCLKVLFENDKESIIVNGKKALKQYSHLKDIVVKVAKNPAPLMNDKTFQKLIPSIQVMFAILFIFLILFIIRSVINVFKNRKKEKRILPKLSPVRKYSIMAFFTSCTFFFKINPSDKGLFVRLVDSVFSFAKLFTFNLSAKEILEKFKDAKIPITGSAIFYSSFISIMVLLCTAFAIFALISKFMNDSIVQLKYYFKIGESYLFSEINENSACLANDIRVKNKHAQIIFTGVNKSESKKEELDFLNSISGGKVRTTSRPITNFHLTKHCKTNVYLIDEEEKNNVKNGKTVFENNKKSDVIINIFSTLHSAETIIDSIDKDKAKATINLVNPAQIIAYDTLWKHPMFEAAERCGSDTMSVMVVGAGYIGMECAKAAMWCGVMDSFKFKINIVDKEDRKKEFDAQFPDFKKNAVKAGIPVDYKFHKADVTTSDFTKVLEKCSDANYIIVAIGDDETTMNTTVAIRKWFVRKAVEDGTFDHEKVPTIIPIIRNSDYDVLAKVLSNNKKESDKGEKKCKIFKRKTENSKVDDYIYPIGSNSDIYKQNLIDEWIVENLAKRIHFEYDLLQPEEDKIDYKNLDQTRKRSSRAGAVHALYKLRDAGYKVKFTDDRLKNIKKNENQSYNKNEKEVETLVKYEHNRWSIFQLLDGWKLISLDALNAIYGEGIIEKHKVSEGMLHGTIVPYKDLESVSEALYGEKDKFTKNDKKIVDYVVNRMPLEFKGINLKKIDNPQSKERKTVMNYTPNPVDTSDVQLSDDLLELSEKLSKNTHEVWAAGRIKDGWSYGETRDDEKRTTPCLVPYDELTEEEKEFDRNTSMETLKLIVKLGYKISK